MCADISLVKTGKRQHHSLAMQPVVLSQRVSRVAGDTLLKTLSCT